MTSRTRGIAAAILVFLLWGMTPLYWSRLHDIAAVEIMAHRVWWSFPLVWLIILIRYLRGGNSAAGIFSRWKVVLWGAAAAVLVAGNWLIYVWAVSRGRTLDASLGYYINPLVNVALGTIILGEKLDTLQKIALSIAAAGVLYLTIWLGSFPWISISLGLSFGIYGYMKKRIPIGSIDSLALEITIIAPVALGFIVFREMTGSTFTSATALEMVLLIGAGAVTVIPLLLFGHATRTIRLTDVGFIQYIAPTMMLIFGVFVLDEPFDAIRLPGFALVWVALVFYTLSMMRGSKVRERL